MNELKTEAINEIKKLREFATWQIVRNGKEPNIPFDHIDYRERKGIISYLRWKFNITEEDLE